MVAGKLKSSFLFLYLLSLLLTSRGAFAQNTDQVEDLFSCESIPQLLQTFEWSGTRSQVLQSMMRSIQNEPLNSGFERQIIQELQKKPWRINSIKALSAEFQVITGQYSAGLITEDDARLRLACALSMFLHRDYLENFDRATIFAPQSVPYKFYTYVRKYQLWQNLTNPDFTTLPLENSASSAESLLSADELPGNIENSVPTAQPKRQRNIDLLQVLYWLFLILTGWVLLAVISGTLLKNQRFTNPVTQRIFSYLLWPFQLLQPLLAARPKGDKKFFGRQQTAYGTPLSEEQLTLMIDQRIAQTENKAPEPTSPAPQTKDNAAAFQTLQQQLNQLQQQLDQLAQQLSSQQEAQEQKAATLQEKLEQYKKEIDNRILSLNQSIALQNNEVEEEEEEPEEVYPTEVGTSHIPGPEPDSVSPEEDEEEETEQRPDDSSAASDQLELTPLAAKDPPESYIYYASSPQQGIFRGQRLEAGFIPRQTVYKITIDKDNPDQASYTMVTHEPTIRLALNIMETYILPAMDLSGPGDIMEATEIGPVEEGRLKKIADDWHIVRKGVLHFS